MTGRRTRIYLRAMSSPVAPAPPPGTDEAYGRGDSLADGAGGDGPPSLELAKAYGRFSRPMRIKDPHQPSGYRLARVGEAAAPVWSPTASMMKLKRRRNKGAAAGAESVVARVADGAGGGAEEQEQQEQAEVYAFWSTHLQQLDEFGIGVALYFRQLAFLSLVFLVAGLIYLPTMWHNHRLVNPPDTPLLLIGSCVGAERGDLSFLYHGAVDLAVCAFLLVFAVASKKVEDAAAQAIDSQQQTTQDYAVEVLNAPRQSKDPEAWAAYFRRWGDVVFVTVALDNGRLLRLLRRRRELRALLQTSIDGMSLLEAERGGASPEALLARQPHPRLLKRLLYRVGLYSHASLVAAEYLRVQTEVASEAVRAAWRARVKRVYAVFNTEAQQRACLAAHRRGFVRRVLGWIGLGKGGAGEFEGVALRVREPVEPSEVRYEAFDVRAWERGLRYAVSTLLAATSLGASYCLLSLARGQPIYTAAITSGMNVALPLFMKIVVAAVEVHIDDSDFQDSILQKLVVARIFAVVVIKYLVTDYAATMAAPTLGAVVSILIADALTNPVLAVLNIPGRFKQWVLAPRARTQREMNLFFGGSEWSLAERYTDLIKTAFLSLFWSSILPGGLFLTALAFFIVSFTDKYNLLYQWKRPPLLDSTLARRARNFLVVGVAVHVVMARVFYANWPFSNADERARCNALLCTYREWYTKDQARTVFVFSILGIAALALVALIYGSFALGSCLQSCCPGAGRRKRRVGSTNTSATDATAAIPFRSLVGAEPYLPLVHSRLFPEPFFAFDVAAVPSRFLPVCARHDHQRQHEDASSDPKLASGAWAGSGSGGSKRASERGLAHLSLCSRKDLPTVQDADARAALFGTVRYYPEAAAGAGAAVGGANDGRGVVVVPNARPQQPKNRMMQVLTPAQLKQPEMAVPLTVAKPLPPGWVVMVDERDGQPYYYHEPTQTVQRDHPMGAPQHSEAAAAAEEGVGAA